MTSVVADTRTLVWYLFEPSRLSAAAGEALDGAIAGGHPVLVSIISIVEILYLVEKGKLPRIAWERVTTQLASGGAIRVVPLDDGVVSAMESIPRQQVPDMPDRIIAATARHLGLALVSRDRKILASDVVTIW